MVNLVKNWKAIKENTGDKLGYYQIFEADGKQEVRVATGRLGFKQQFEAESPELKEIAAFCRNRFVEISGNIRDDVFFK